MDFNGKSFELPDFDRAYLECEEMFTEADDLIKELKITEAVEKLNKIVQRNPKFGKAYNHLGWIYENKYKNYARADDYYKLALQHAPEYHAIYLNYAYFLSNLSRFDELKKHLDKALNVTSVAKDTLYNEYANMYEMQSEPETAIDYYFKAAMISLDGDKIQRYKDAIERCKQKIELKNSMNEFGSNQFR